MSVAQCTVEFVGGPFDGYQQAISFAAEQLATIAALPVNANVLRMIAGEPRCEREPASSVAIYELERDAMAVRYRYLFARSAKEFPNEVWVV